MATMTPASGAEAARGRLGDRAILRQLQSFVSGRVPSGEVEDVVQTVLCVALGAPKLPAREEDLRRWLFGIARHKIADHHRAASRQGPVGTPEIGVAPPPYEARAMVDWAEGAARSEFRSSETLRWMAREGEGEALATIAADENLPPARLRQRVSRLRRALKRRWGRELALAVGAGLLVLLGWMLWTQPNPHPVVRDRSRSTPDPATERGRQMRAGAMRACSEQRWSACLDGLDRAKRLDPAGDRQPAVGTARQQAIEALSEPAPQPPSSTTSSPTATPTDPTSPSPAPTATSASTTRPVPKRLSPKPSGPRSTKPGTGLK